MFRQDSTPCDVNRSGADFKVNRASTHSASQGRRQGGRYPLAAIESLAVIAIDGLAFEISRDPAAISLMSPLSPCSLLPPLRLGLDWRELHAHRAGQRGAEFYLACLEYAQVQWQRGLAARALLCLDRAFGADLKGDEGVLRTWPLPYAALVWIVANTPTDVFIGNPRVHFQHYADRMNEPRRDQRRARAWACWALVRAIRPNLPPDPRHDVHEPSIAEITTALQQSGHAGETALWQTVLNSKSCGSLSMSR